MHITDWHASISNLYQKATIPLIYNSFASNQLLFISCPKPKQGNKHAAPAISLSHSNGEEIMSPKRLLIGMLVAAIGASAGYLGGWPLNPARDFSPRLFAYSAGWGKPPARAR